MLSLFKKRIHQNEKLISKFKKYPDDLKKIKNYQNVKEVTFQDLERFGQYEHFQFKKNYYNLFLFKNGARQKVSLVKTIHHDLYQSMLDSKKNKELLRITLRSDSGTYQSEIFQGNENRVSSFKEIEKIIYQLRSTADAAGEKTQSIHIVHTHPSYEIYGYDRDKSFVSLHPLSKNDLNLLCEIQYRYEFPIELTAITLSGIQYSATFHDLFSS